MKFSRKSEIAWKLDFLFQRGGHTFNALLSQLSYTPMGTVHCFSAQQ